MPSVVRASLSLVLIALFALGCAADGDSGPRDVADRATPRADATTDIDPGMDSEVPPEDSETPGLDSEAPDDIASPEDTSPPEDTATPDIDAATPDDAAPDVPELPDVVTEVDTGPLPPIVDVITTGAPADAPARFSGTEDSSRAPTIVYPSPDTIIPPNLAGLEVHFLPGAGNELFEVAFEGPMSTVRVYAPCTRVGSGCAVAIDEATIRTIARASRPSDQVQLSVRGTTTAGGAFGRSSSRTLGLTTTALRGGIYYWAAAAGNIMRYEFGLPGARAEVYLTGGGPFACLGCHSLSRDGRRVAVGRFIPGPSTMQTYDVSSRATVGGTYPSNFATYSPDNTRVLTSDGARLALLDAVTGTAAPGLATGTTGTHPDWSPDGRAVVYSRPASVPPFGGTPGHGAPADLLVLPWRGADFGTPSVLVRAGAGENNYYPSYSPDGSWVLFNRSNGDSYNNIAAHLYAVNTAGSAAAVRLAAADGEGDLGNSWPKWAPFVETYQGQPLMWLTFSSRRDYGLRLVQQSRPAEERRTQLWMAAFRPGLAGSGDPSVPAFWLPMQSLAEGNHIAQWTQVVRRQTCVGDSDCLPTEYCRRLTSSGVCVAR